MSAATASATTAANATKMAVSGLTAMRKMVPTTCLAHLVEVLSLDDTQKDAVQVILNNAFKIVARKPANAPKTRVESTTMHAWHAYQHEQKAAVRAAVDLERKDLTKEELAARYAAKTMVKAGQEVQKRLGDAWKALTDEQKKVYETKEIPPAAVGGGGSDSDGIELPEKDPNYILTKVGKYWVVHDNGHNTKVVVKSNHRQKNNFRTVIGFLDESGAYVEKKPEFEDFESLATKFGLVCA
jgi:hypothetical protein